MPPRKKAWSEKQPAANDGVPQTLPPNSIAPASTTHSLLGLQPLPNLTPHLEPSMGSWPKLSANDSKMLPVHVMFRPKMNLPTVNDQLHPSFPKSVLTKKDVINIIDNYLKLIIEDLSSQRKYVPSQIIEDILRRELDNANRSSKRDYISRRDIPTWEKFYKTHGRVEEYIKCFCALAAVSSLYELEQAIISSEQVHSFDELHLGPLLKHPLVQQYFKPPPDLQSIPEVSLYDIMSSLRECLHQKSSRNSKITLEQFVEFMRQKYSKPSKEHLCIKISSFPLAIQTISRFTRAERDATRNMEVKLQHQLQITLEHQAAQLKQQIQKDFSSYPAARKNFPELIESMYNICSKTGKKNSNHLATLLNHVHYDPVFREAFMCMVYSGAYAKDLTNLSTEKNTNTSNVPVYQISRQPEIRVLEKVVEALNALQYPIDLASLSRIEEKIAEDFLALDFSSLGNGTFLRFLATHEAAIKALGGNTIGSNQVTHNHKRQHILSLISQLKDQSCMTTISKCIVQHFGATAEVLGCGNMEKLVTDGMKAPKQEDPSIIYVTPFLLQNGDELTELQPGNCTVGRLGQQSLQDALNCLNAAPLLEDLNEWTHWDFIYAPIFGDLGDFIQKHGSSRKLYAIEICPGKLHRVDMNCTRQDFNHAVEVEDHINAAGYLVSYIFKCGGINAASMALFADQILTTVQNMAAIHDRREKAASMFILHCMLRIPLRICGRIALEVFLDPLKKVFSQSAIDGLLLYCKNSRERIFLQSLGLFIGIKSWIEDFKKMTETHLSNVHKLSNAANKLQDTECIKIGNSISSTPSPLVLENVTSKTLLTHVAVQTPSQYVTEVQAEKVICNEEREIYCRNVIERIRREEFGIGMELDDKGKMIAEKQRSREGRSLARLSKELYSTDTHFVLELIQNADDNEYSKDLLLNESSDVPSLKFIVSSNCIKVLNNEVGFSEENIQAICDVGRSTKAAKRSGYIGQKGIGFKSVFRVSDTPHVHSNGYHFMFDTTSGHVGYILPHWYPEDSTNLDENERWTTRIVLPLKDINNSEVMLRKFNDIQPSLLLFLNRLRKIAVKNEITGEIRVMKRIDKSDKVVIIQHDETEDHWLVQRKVLSNTTKYKTEVLSTEIALAFPIPANQQLSYAKDLSQQQVFAFLPLRTYGFRFVLQGDFDLPSAREDVNNDSLWNQWLREQIPSLFKDALLSCKEGLLGMPPVQATAYLLQFIPLDGEIHDFFRPVSTLILDCVRGIPCLPSDPVMTYDVENPDVLSLITSSQDQSYDSLEGTIRWVQPSQLLIVHDEFIKDHISQNLLTATLHKYYMNSELIDAINQPLQRQLRINGIGVDHLISVAHDVIDGYLSQRNQSIVHTNNPKDASDQTASQNAEEILIKWIANWFACVEIVMCSNHDLTTTTLSKLRDLRVVPLSNGNIVCAESNNIFFPPSQQHNADFKHFEEIYKELMVVDAKLFKESDDDCKTKAILKKIGVNELCVSDVIRHHIVPQFRSENCKKKSKAVLYQYMCYIKKYFEKLDSSEAEDLVCQLKSSAVVCTISHGLQQPMQDPVHFSSVFHPIYDLKKLFPGVEWFLLDPIYVKGEKSNNDSVDSWRKFFENIGIQTGIAVQPIETHISEGSDQWSELRELRRSPDGSYMIRDYWSREVQQIIQKGMESTENHQQMKNLLVILDSMWEYYAKYMYANVYDGANKNSLGCQIPSSLCKTLIGCQWIPAKTSTNPLYCFQNHYYRSCELYEDTPRIRRLLENHVPYIAMDIKSELAKTLKLKNDVNFEEMVQLMKEWKKVSQNKNSFLASTQHMAEVYSYLWHQQNQEVPISQSIFGDGDDEYIFVPNELKEHSPADTTTGKFYSAHNVCWRDPTAVLKQLLRAEFQLPSDIPKPLSLYYGNVTKSSDLKFVFSHLGVATEPNLAQLISLLCYVSSLSPVPEEKDLNYFVSIIEVIISQCKDDITRQKFVQTGLADKKVFPVQEGWVSLNDMPLDNDDENIYKIFKSIKGANFLKWPVGSTHDKNITAIRRDMNMLLSIPSASQCVQTSIVPELIVYNYDLQSKLKNYLQLIQCYLKTMLPLQYEALCQVKDQLQRLQCFTADKLDVTYVLRVWGNELYAPPAQSKCELSESEFILYILKSKSNENSVLIEPLCKLFLKKSTSEERREFRTFILEILLKNPCTEEQTQDIMNSYCLSPVGSDEGWSLSCKMPQEQVKTNNGTIEWIDDETTNEHTEIDEEDTTLHCWPPNSHSPRYAEPAKTKSPYHSQVPKMNYEPTKDDVINADDIQKARNKLSNCSITNDGKATEECDASEEIRQNESKFHQHSASDEDPVNSSSINSEQSKNPGKVVRDSGFSTSRKPQVHRTSGDSQLQLEPVKPMCLPERSKEVAITLKPLDIKEIKENIIRQLPAGGNLATGEWGEKFLYLYLNQRKSLPNGKMIKKLTWINEGGESLKPYDLIAEDNDGILIYIEVKSTSGSQNQAALSWNELKFAKDHGANYHVYRVYEAGKESCNISYIEGLTLYLDNNPTVLYLLI